MFSVSIDSADERIAAIWSFDTDSSVLALIAIDDRFRRELLKEFYNSLRGDTTGRTKTQTI